MSYTEIEVPEITLVEGEKAAEETWLKHKTFFFFSILKTLRNFSFLQSLTKREKLKVRFMLNTTTLTFENIHLI